MKIKKIGILKEKHLDENTKIETLKNSGLTCFCSDLARLMGCDYDSTKGVGSYWYDSPVSDNKKKNGKKYIDSSGMMRSVYANKGDIGVRIAISFNDIEDFKLKAVNNLVCEYPLFIMNGIVGKTIDGLFDKKSKLIYRTGRVHDVNHVKYDEYEALGIKFIKYPNKTTSKILSDGTTLEEGKSAYIKVDKIPFVVDEKSQLIYSSVILFPSVFGENGGEYSNSTLDQYLNNEFLKSINDELEHKEPALEFPDEQKCESNRYKFDFTPLTEEEIIEICINSNIAVFLHGKTGTGKTERMVALDRNLELIDFGCTSSDGFTGIIAKDFNSKELFLYEPYWYKSLCEKCKNEPDVLHILFLEELTNAKSDVQKIAFEVTLNKTLTNSGFRLKLPENAVVCAAGNEANESRSANALSEPLFGRFAHVYIDTNSEDWLKWALKRKKEGKKLKYEKQDINNDIHPAIIDYVKINGDDVLRTQYSGVTPHADPRKWAMASKALYKSNNPNVLRAFVGEEIAEDFIKFSQLNLVTIDDVINDRCTADKVSYDPSIRWYTTLCLSSVDDQNVDKVREFVGGLGKEFLAMFDYEWSKDNDERIMKLYSNTEAPYVKRIEPNGNK